MAGHASANAVTATRLIASGLGCGFARRAPGTVASAAAAAVGLLLLAIGPAALALGAVVAVIGGWRVVTLATSERDPAWVVIDEVAGQWIAMLALPGPSVAGALAAFALFRLFDIAKPGPVGWAERLPGALGIMADDVVAGAMAALLLGLGEFLLG